MKSKTMQKTLMKMKIKKKRLIMKRMKNMKQIQLMKTKLRIFY